MNITPNILIVDDETLNIDFIAQTLKHDYQIKVSTSGEDALKIISKFDFDLILLDIHMPLMDGYEVAKQLQENPKTQNIPIIFLTADNDTESLIKGFDYGAKDYIIKPFNQKELVVRVRNHINSYIFEKNLKKEKNFISTIIDNANSIIAVINKDGVMTKINKYGEDFVEYSQSEIASEPYFWKKFLPIENQDTALWFSEDIDQNILTKSFQNSLVSKKGVKKIFEWSNTLVKKEDGTIDYLLLIGLDITEQAKQSLLIEEQKEEFETIFKKSKDGIAIFDLESRFLDFNNAYLEMTGFRREELLGKSCIEITVTEDRDRTKKALDIAIRNGYVENFEKSCLVNHGKVITINMSLSLLPDRQRVLISAKNITANKLLESQSKLASMGEMIGNIAHQWRQPLSVISTIASGISFKKEFGNLKEEEIIPNMENIVKQTNYLSKTIEDFRNFIKGNQIEEIFTATQLFEKTLSIMHSSLENHFIKVVSHIDCDITIKGYENELMQAFINIINNAKDALMENKDLEDKYIFIEAKTINHHCEIIIKDNGGGIKPSVVERIFEPYFTTKHQSVGTGLGLSMAHKIITQMHRGEIKVSNTTFIYNDQEYQGAAFHIVLSS